MSPDPYAHCNFTIPSADCTLETCCLAQSSFLYIPNYGANLFFVIFFAAFILPQLGLGWYYRTWGFTVGAILGLILEVVGYVARLLIHDNPFGANGFLIYLICLTIAPVFLSAAIYLCLTRIIALYGADLSRFKPRTIAIVFMTSDFLSLLLQAVGGALADTATTHKEARPGVDIMIAGLVLQAVSLAIFLLVSADFAWSCRKGQLAVDPEKRRIRGSLVFKAFLASVGLATIVVLVRSIFRVMELWEGFNGDLWNNETDFLILDGGMIGIAVLCLTAFHPGFAFGRQMWQGANWSFKTKKATTAATDGYPMKSVQSTSESRSILQSRA